jgi:hypothetical protein
MPKQFMTNRVSTDWCSSRVVTVSVRKRTLAVRTDEALVVHKSPRALLADGTFAIRTGRLRVLGRRVLGRLLLALFLLLVLLLLLVLVLVLLLIF